MSHLPQDDIALQVTYPVVVDHRTAVTKSILANATYDAVADHYTFKVSRDALGDIVGALHSHGLLATVTARE